MEISFLNLRKLKIKIDYFTKLVKSVYHDYSDKINLTIHTCINIGKNMIWYVRTYSCIVPQVSTRDYSR